MRCRSALRIFVYFLNRTPEVENMLRGWNKTFQFDLEGEPVFHVAVRDQRAALADVVFSAPSKLFLQIVTGEINADEAFLNKKYDAVGSPADVTRFRMLGERVQEYHPRPFGLLRRMGTLATRLGL